MPFPSSAQIQSFLLTALVAAAPLYGWEKAASIAHSAESRYCHPQTASWFPTPPCDWDGQCDWWATADSLFTSELGVPLRPVLRETPQCKTAETAKAFFKSHAMRALSGFVTAALGLVYARLSLGAPPAHPLPRMA
jgi:hypothetical protein